MKKIVSFVMVLTLSFILFCPAFATSDGLDLDLIKKTFDSYETDDLIVTKAESGNGQMMISVIDDKISDKIFQWIGNVSENICSIPIEELTIETLLQEPNVEILNVVESEQAPYAVTSTNNLLNDVIDDVKSIYRSDCVWWPIVVDRSTYAPLIITIRQDDYYDAEETGRGYATISSGSTITSVAAGLAKHFKWGVASVLGPLAALWDAYNFGSTAMDDLIVDGFRGIYICEYTGTVKTSINGTETPVGNGASRSNYHYYLEVDGDLYKDGDECDEIYYPSKYEFDLDRLVENTYKAYIG